MTNPHFKTIDDFKDVSFITQYYINVQNDERKIHCPCVAFTRDNARRLCNGTIPARRFYEVPRGTHQRQLPDNQWKAK